mmetsp:Transcript_1867/g.3195  ORF Transcript_1867/g.3195 Transcript_1867/m.3195 type:complete len:335 (-) Transcript_1867:2511-3515(-)|eukprot:CAMPEP_0203757120 /NCGR_PEP_ID=MMETSP0098-20131031/10261_1 /ASSEMBLY_ACC=CAM_ASM_000208 /TAXON_ID=96639 /ORGANISM=" , Strain NY0313808BC1" /LENGTH=334 /DNA_ID=CAMNT_0050649243 /DNA_START=15 /DNA_END=1019 /DNA_ORIENTATION=-
MRVACAAISLALSSVVADAGYVAYKPVPTECACESKCSVWGDPHIINFNGEKSSLYNEEFVLYTYKDFELKALTDGAHDVQIVNITYNGASTTFTANKTCGETHYNNNDIVFRQSYELDKSNGATVLLKCHDSANRAPHHFNLDIVANNTGEDIGFVAQGSGECVKFTESNPVTPTDENGTCVCEQFCVARGDPHITAFNEKTKAISTQSFQEIMLYETPGLRVIGGLDQMKHLQNFTVTEGNVNSTYTVDELCVGQNIPNGHDAKVITVPLGDDMAKLHLQCNTRPNDYDLDHNYMDFKMKKVDTTQQAFSNFTEMEIDMGSNGYCVYLNGPK